MVLVAAAAESALVLLALGLGWWWRTPPFARLEWTLGGLAAGVAATAPLLLGLQWCRHTRWPPLRRLVETAQARVAPLFRGAGPGELLLVAVAAGVAEEALFRGVVQTVLAGPLGPAGAVVAAAALFGAAHWITPVYALLAGVVGGYLGLLFHLSSNLLAPIVTHGLYDLIALAVLVRMKPAPSGSVV